MTRPDLTASDLVRFVWDATAPASDRRVADRRESVLGVLSASELEAAFAAATPVPADCPRCGFGEGCLRVDCSCCAACAAVTCSLCHAALCDKHAHRQEDDHGLTDLFRCEASCCRGACERGCQS